jgi:hypothetical protein
MRPLTYSLQFRGLVEELDGRLRKEARAPGCALVTSLTPGGLEGRYVWALDDDEALFLSTLAFTGDASFEEHGTIHFARGHALHLVGVGELAASPDPHLRQGTVAWEVTGGDGAFAGARGRVTSNVLLSDTGDLTESQLGVVFTSGSREPDQGSPRREQDRLRETIEPVPDTDIEGGTT